MAKISIADKVEGDFHTAEEWNAFKASINALYDELQSLTSGYIREELNEQEKYLSNKLKVATDRIMLVSEGLVISNGPVNDAAPGNPYPGGATPTSWNHDPETGTITFPYLITGIIEIYIRPLKTI